MPDVMAYACANMGQHAPTRNCNRTLYLAPRIPCYLHCAYPVAIG